MIIPDRYVANAPVPGGGMGDVFECTDKHLKRRVIVKMLKDGEDDRRLSDELKALVKVRSKHVVQLYDVIEVEAALGRKKALVMEYINGQDLSDLTFKTNDAYLKVLWQVACGLSEIHKFGLIHRDIKANNIRLDDASVVKILDFGLARTAGVDSKTISIIGTPTYMAPELFSDKTVLFTQAVDVYAFGITALSLISESLPQEFYAYPPRPLSNDVILNLLKGVPEEVKATLAKCLSFSAEDRPSMASVEESIRSRLLFNRHRALMVLGSNKYEINSLSPRAKVSVVGLGELIVEYDGVRFKVSDVSGNVCINNASAIKGSELPAACVITFGSHSAGRKFVTFDVSNPEIAV